MCSATLDSLVASQVTGSVPEKMFISRNGDHREPGSSGNSPSITNRGRTTKYRFALGIAALVAILAASRSPAQFDLPQGNKTVVVLSARYANTEPPALTDVQWATAFNNVVSPYYTAATTDTLGGVSRSAVNFTFIAGRSIGGPSTYDLPFDVGNRDDPLLLHKEGLAALIVFDAANPGVMLDLERRLFVIVVNGPKRARAGNVYPFKTSLGIWVNLSIAVIEEPHVPDVLFEGNQVMMPEFDQDGEPVLDDAGVQRRVVDTLTPSILAHELGHMLGLPDLYGEPGEVDHEFVGKWCPMGERQLNNFCGWSRSHQGWLPPDKIFVPPMPQPGTELNVVVNLFPPRTTSQPGFELIMIPTDEQLRDWIPAVAAVGRMFGLTGPGDAFFTGYIAEHRRPIELDAPRTGAADTTGAPLDSIMEQGLPTAYEAGLLVSYAKPGLLPRYEPLNPLDVIRLSSGDSLESAPLQNPEEFSDTKKGVRITPLELNADGSMRVRIRWKIPPRPQLSVRDTWIDSPVNGFGTFLFGGSAVGTIPPLGAGDPVHIPMTVVWSPGLFGIPYPTLVPAPVAHRVQVRVRNTGAVPISRIRGRLIILEPQMLALNLIDPSNIPASLPAVLAGLNPLSTIDLDSTAAETFALITGGGPILPPGGEGNFSVSFTPSAPFMGIALLDTVEAAPEGISSAQTEAVIDLWDNWRLEPYLILTTSAGSPYKKVQLDVPIRNANRDERLFMPALDGSGNGEVNAPSTWWRTKLDPSYKSLKQAERTVFQVSIQPPDPPAHDKQGTDLGLTAWMNRGDTMVPVCRLPFKVVTNKKSRLRVAFDSKGGLTGILTAKTVAGEFVAAEGCQIVLTWSSSDGQTKQLLPGESGYEGVTNAEGRYSQSNHDWIHIRAGVRYKGIAEFMGNEEVGPAKAETAIMDVSKGDDKADLVVSLKKPRTKSFLLNGLRCTLSLSEPLAQAELNGLQTASGLPVVVSNIGNRAAKKSVLRVYASPDCGVESQGPEIRSVDVPPLDAGSSATVRVGVKPRSNSTCFILLLADGNRAVEESNENNNFTRVDL